VGRGLAVGWNLGVGVTRGVEVGVEVTVGVGGGEIVAVAVAVGVGLTVAVAVAVGVTSDLKGTTTSTFTGEPVLKKLIVACPALGGALESNRKLYSVPQRTALAFWFCAKVSQFQARENPLLVTVHGVLL
jgi:hypothetical protein